MTIKIKAVRDMFEEPVFIKTEAAVDGGVKSAVGADGAKFPAQATEGGVVVLATMKRGETTELTLSEDSVNSDIKLTNSETDRRVDIEIGGKPFTSYIYDGSNAKPYLGPVHTPDGQSYTRLDFTTKEHPHHRSIFVAVGDVNGIDFWNEPADHGVEIPAGIGSFESGACFAAFTAKNIWKNLAGVPQLDETRRTTVYNQSEGCRYIDIAVTFEAAYGDVVFGPTKEAGPLGIRMNEELRADKGTGRMVNSYGAENEGECWGRSAHWCDYSGTLSGKPYGIAVFDSEKNERYPTAWHIRNYGLFAANNLFFKGGLTIKSGETLTYSWRIAFHGAGFDARDRFINYLNSGR